MDSFDTAQTCAAPHRARAERAAGSGERCVRPPRPGGDGGGHGLARVGEGADVARFSPA